MEFQVTFKNWINESLSCDLPSTVGAFCFNLFETGIDFGIELVGCPSYDENDPDWACDEIFEAKQRSIDIPLAYSGENWEECLEKMKELTVSFMCSNEPGAKVLNKAGAVGIGFVDGDLEILSKP